MSTSRKRTKKVLKVIFSLDKTCSNRDEINELFVKDAIDMIAAHPSSDTVTMVLRRILNSVNGALKLYSPETDVTNNPVLSTVFNEAEGIWIQIVEGFGDRKVVDLTLTQTTELKKDFFRLIVRIFVPESFFLHQMGKEY